MSFEKLIDHDCANQNEEMPEIEDSQQKFDSICEYDEKQWPTTIEDEKKYFESNGNVFLTLKNNSRNLECNDQMMDESEETKDMDMLETTSNTFNKDLFLDLLLFSYPSLKEELHNCAPEFIWFKIKELTGIDIENVIKIYEEYVKDNSCDHCSENKKILKRKLVETIVNDNNKRQC